MAEDVPRTSSLKDLPSKLRDRYFRLRGIELLDIDHDTIRVQVGKKKRIVTLTVNFPSDDYHSQFLNSKRTLLDFYKAKGKLIFLPSPEDFQRAAAKGIPITANKGTTPDEKYRLQTYAVLAQVFECDGHDLIEDYNYAEQRMLAHMARKEA